jgi:ubiquinone biosynthesis protein UbiJ
MKSFFLKQLEKALKRYLALDPESSKRLLALQGKTVTLALKAPSLCFQLSFQENTVYLRADDFLPAELTIRGTPLNLLSLALSRDKKQHFFSETVVIEGDAELGQQIVDLFDQLDIDWEEYLSHLMGDLPAHQLGRFTKRFFAWGKEAEASLMQNLNEYVHEEKLWFPPAEALENFFRDIDELRLDVDRLEAKVRLLQAED